MDFDNDSLKVLLDQKNKHTVNIPYIGCWVQRHTCVALVNRCLLMIKLMFDREGQKFLISTIKTWKKWTKSWRLRNFSPHMTHSHVASGSCTCSCFVRDENASLNNHGVKIWFTHLNIWESSYQLKVANRLSASIWISHTHWVLSLPMWVIYDYIE